MTGYTSDEEQIEAIRRWWRENGRSVIAGIVIALVAVVGWQQWRSYQEGRAMSASGGYQAVQADLGDDDATAAAEEVKRLQQDYADTPYAALGSFQLAASFVKADKLDAAAEQLRWILDNTDETAFRTLARLRLGDVLLAANKPGEAKKILEPAPDGAFAARFQELLGDVHAAESDRKAAIAAYRKALDAGVSGQRRRLVELKLDDLGAAAEPAS
ncbi:MAG: tetratricopeptide repeat protein [Ectothiorhodospiraceae bacterium]